LLSHKARAIVIGLDSMQGLQLTRILAGHGITVFGITNNPKYHTTRTRACREVLHVDTGTEDLVDLLIEIAQSFDHGLVLFPRQDRNVLVTSRHRNRLRQHYRIGLPSESTVEMMTDKVQFHAPDRGFRILAPLILTCREDAEGAADALTYPCMLKRPRGIAGWIQQMRDKAMSAEDARGLLDLHDRRREWTEVLVAQQWIEGSDADLLSCNTYFGSGTRFCIRRDIHPCRTRTWGGSEKCGCGSLRNSRSRRTEAG